MDQKFELHVNLKRKSTDLKGHRTHKRTSLDNAILTLLNFKVNKKNCLKQFFTQNNSTQLLTRMYG